MPAHPFEIRTLKGATAYDEVFEPILTARSDRPYVVAQLGQSLDGRIATPTGASRWINGPAALDHLHRLRAHVDAVVVGVGTVIADDPLLTVRRVPGRQPARVVIDPRGRLCRSARCLSNDGVRRIVVRAHDEAHHASPYETVIVELTGDTFEPAAIAESLYDLGLRKILIEGGARTVSHFLDARAVDRLHLLVAPVILGSGTTGISLAPIADLDEAKRPRTRVHQLDGGDVLFDCDLSGHRRG